MAVRETPQDLLERGAREGIYTHASLAVWRRGAPVLEAHVPAAGAVFDVASVTKVATAALALKVLGPAHRVAWLPGAPEVRDLLAHRSGLPAWRPLFALAAQALGASVPALVASPALQSRARSMVRSELAAATLGAPRPTYSDLGFLSLGFELEDAAGDALDTLARTRLFAPLGLSTSWGGEREDAVPTGRGRPRAGNPAVETDRVAAAGVEPEARDAAVDDDNAAALGGTCGHAGVWATAREVARLGDALREAAESDSGILPRGLAVLLFERDAQTPGSTRTFGLDTPSGPAPAIGSRLGRGARGAAGHLGFTGCSLWIDRDEALSIAFLSNAVLRARPSAAIRAFRPAVHDAVAAALGLGP